MALYKRLKSFQHHINAFGGQTLPSGSFVGELSYARNQVVWWRYMAAGGDARIP
jgi:hypothetical protein